MSVAPKLLNCQINMTYFVKSYEIIVGYLEENEEQLPWKQSIACEAYISYFSKEYTHNAIIIIIIFKKQKLKD